MKDMAEVYIDKVGTKLTISHPAGLRLVLDVLKNESSIH